MKKKLILLILLLGIFFFSLFSSYSLNSDFGKVESSIVEIDTNQGVLSGLLYKPVNFKGQQFPAIVIAHGISESAQIVSGLGLELCRGGFVVLCLDLPGHGASYGSINQGQQDPALGVDTAVNYVANLSFVDSTRIGLVGHSLGAGAIRAANTRLSNVQASVLIGGGVDSSEVDLAYGSLNATYPKNVLVIVGEYDILFDSSNLAKKDLLELFNTTGFIQQGVLYGDFNLQTARKLIVPKTTHLFESLDATAISQTTEWMQQTLKNTHEYEKQNSPIYQYREIAQSLSVIALVGLILLTFNLAVGLLKEKNKTFIQEFCVPRWKAYLIWFMLNLSLFFPLIAVGFLIGFPPLIFGSSIAWWLLLLALISILIFKLLNRDSKLRKTSTQAVMIIKQNLPTKNTLVIAILLFLILVAVASFLQDVGISLKIIAPIFQEFNSAMRVLMFFTFLPFFVLYFFIQQLYLIPNDYLHKGKTENIKIIFVNISPFLLFLALNFLPKIIFGFWILPSFAGFLIEFLWLMVPIFIMTMFCNLYFYKQTENFGVGTIFNTLLLAWIAATVFPF
jgi:dienelactone hydrolase